MKLMLGTLTIVLSIPCFALTGEEISEDLDHHVTGVIVELEPMAATLNVGHGGPFYINTAFDTAEKHLKVGQRVTFHYYVTGRGKLIADKVEKAGKSENGWKNR